MTIFQKGGSTHAPLTLLVTRVVLLHKAYGVSNPLIPQLYVPTYEGLQHMLSKVFMNFTILRIARFSRYDGDRPT